MGAMPLIAEADHVVVLTGSEQREKVPAASGPLLDIGAYLKRHGVEAEIRKTDAAGSGSPSSASSPAASLIRSAIRSRRS